MRAAMPALAEGIHFFRRVSKEDVDGRDDPGHDVERLVTRRLRQLRHTVTNCWPFTDSAKP